MDDPSSLPTGAPQASSRPGPEHEALIRMIYDMIDTRLDDRLPKLGTVRGMDGGKVRVQIDDEDDPRSVGFPRKTGQRYRNGDRVVLMPTQSGGGDHVVLGTVTGNQGKASEGVVDTADLAQNAVTKTELAQNAVDTGNVVDNAITEGKIKDNAVSNSKLDAATQRALASIPTNAQISAIATNVGEDGKQTKYNGKGGAFKTIGDALRDIDSRLGKLE